MWNSLLTSVTEQSRSFNQSAVEFNQLVLRQVEKLAQAQLESFNAYASLNLKQLQAASKLADVDQVKAFVTNQADYLKAVQARVQEDTTKLGQLAEESRKELTGFVAERAPAFEAPKTTKKAA